MTSNNFLTFPLINLKLVDQYKWKDPIIMSKYNFFCNAGYFHGGSNININLIMYKDNIVIMLLLQSYVLHWYHTYILYPVIEII